MEYEYSKKFSNDLKRHTANKELIGIVAKKIQHISKAKNKVDITELVAITKTTSHYRIKIKLSDKSVLSNRHKGFEKYNLVFLFGK